MNLDTVSDKHLHELERLVGELLAVIRQAKLQEESLVEMLRDVQVQAGNARRARFDAAERETNRY